ncbi:flippase-like domain-containing protein [Methanonatronarchaeum sp. AMET-Sl]|uniref:lysylphosphatidylglycerol synthase transmembrane domain-containing protein n=1 Tax=Methanonatronarchaeum sp. AMET-Sl TaxID=3037654 RepID=UPI00244DC28C|nr:flippase-like domain-containing protein [Methanonatronarchaeum sp. AMET-Sl]WGI16647.1 flippase-like domain-containing protein [Methanonatronarchaeum sp. AMET-Sl]
MNRPAKLLLISLSISIITILGIIMFTVPEGLVEGLKQIDLFYLALAATLHITGWMFWTGRVNILAKASKMPLSYFTTLKIVLSSSFAAAITPSYAGGEPVRLYLLSREEKSSGGIATAIVISERAMDIFFLIIFGTISIFVLGERFTDYISMQIAYLFIALIFLTTIIGVLTSLFKPIIIKKTIGFLSRPLEKIRPGTINQINREIDSYNEVLWKYIKNKNKKLLIASILTFGLWGVEFSIPYVILTGLGQEVDFLTAWAGYALVMLIVMIPTTPGGSGVAEIGASIVYSAIAGTALIGIFVLIWRAVTYYLDLIIGGITTSIVLKDIKEIQDKIKKPLEKTN